MDVRQLRYFTGVVEADSFTKTAARLNVAQSTLSLLVRHSENVPLARRSVKELATIWVLPHACCSMSDWGWMACSVVLKQPEDASTLLLALIMLIGPSTGSVVQEVVVAARTASTSGGDAVGGALELAFASCVIDAATTGDIHRSAGSAAAVALFLPL